MILHIRNRFPLSIEFKHMELKELYIFKIKKSPPSLMDEEILRYSLITAVPYAITSEAPFITCEVW